MQMQAQTNCDAIMISRGALGNPWIFKEILSGAPYRPSLAEWYDVVRRHLDYHAENYGNSKISAGLIKKQLIWYAKGFPQSKNLRCNIKFIETLDDARELLRDYIRKFPGELKRYSSSEIEKEKLTNDYDPKYEMDRTLDRGVGCDHLSD